MSARIREAHASLATLKMTSDNALLVKVFILQVQTVSTLVERVYDLGWVKQIYRLNVEIEREGWRERKREFDREIKKERGREKKVGREGGRERKREIREQQNENNE